VPEQYELETLEATESEALLPEQRIGQQDQPASVWEKESLRGLSREMRPPSDPPLSRPSHNGEHASAERDISELEAFAEAGAAWGFADEDGYIRMKDPATGHRVIGQVRDNNPAASLGYFALKFKRMEDRFAEIEQEAYANDFKPYLLGKVRYMLDYVPEANALGDFERLIERLEALEDEIAGRMDDHRQQKEILCIRAEEQCESTDWRGTTEHLRQLHEEWKATGSAGRELDEALWMRFKGAQELFYERRREYFEQRNREYEEHRAKKEELCAQAEEWSRASDWREASEAMKELHAQWKQIGSAGRDYEEELWNRFNAAQQQFFEVKRRHFEEREHLFQENRERKEDLCDQAELLAESDDWREAGDAFKRLMEDWKEIGPAGRGYEEELWTRLQAARSMFYTRRAEFFEHRDRIEQENLQRKEALCAQAEELLAREDPFTAIPEVKQLQSDWKTIGHVPRDRMEEVWDRFRRACDGVFERVDAERERRRGERKPSDWHVRLEEVRERKIEQANRIRESIDHDEENIARWEDTIAGLREGGRAEEIRESLEHKISDVSERIQSKHERLRELEASIQDIESQIRNSD
jgi:hypothetical protein